MPHLTAAALLPFHSRVLSWPSTLSLEECRPNNNASCNTAKGAEALDDRKRTSFVHACDLSKTRTGTRTTTTCHSPLYLQNRSMSRVANPDFRFGAGGFLRAVGQDLWLILSGPSCRVWRHSRHRYMQSFSREAAATWTRHWFLMRSKNLYQPRSGPRAKTSSSSELQRSESCCNCLSPRRWRAKVYTSRRAPRTSWRRCCRHLRPRLGTRAHEGAATGRAEARGETGEAEGALGRVGSIRVSGRDDGCHLVARRIES